MAKETTTLNGGMGSKMVEGRIRRKIQKQWRQVFSSFLNLFPEDDRWSLLRFVVAVPNFHWASDYTMVGDMLLLVINFIRG
jgi:hypothetical protein